jgi:dipeptidase D
VATIAVPESQLESFTKWLDEETQVIRSEYRTTDPDSKIELSPGDATSRLPEGAQTMFLGAIYGCPNGIFRMSPDIEDLVQTSNNLAQVRAGDGQIEIACLTRSSVNTERDDLADMITALFEMTGANVTCSGDYPGWKPAPESDIVKLMSALYEEQFGESAHVAACHAGLECGILGTNYPEMEMISFGPNIRGAHSPDEKVQISSVQKFWGYLLETLKRIQ